MLKNKGECKRDALRSWQRTSGIDAVCPTTMKPESPRFAVCRRAHALSITARLMVLLPKMPSVRTLRAQICAMRSTSEYPACTRFFAVSISVRENMPASMPCSRHM